MKNTRRRERVKGDERGMKVSGANWEAWLNLQPILWSHGSVIITWHGGLVCVCVCAGESASDGWSNAKISG